MLVAVVVGMVTPVVVAVDVAVLVTVDEAVEVPVDVTVGIHSAFEVAVAGLTSISFSLQGTQQPKLVIF